MKILFLTYDLPFPLNSGGKIRAYYLIKNLSQNHQITLFSYYRHEEQKRYLREMEKYCSKVLLFKRPPAWSWQNLLRCFLTPLPFAAATYYSNSLKEALKKELLNNHYDLVHFESFYPALYLPLVKKLGVKTLMGNENIEYQVYQRYARQKWLGLRQILQLEVFRMRLFEEELWRQADTNIALSEPDSLEIKRVTQKECPIIANGVDLPSFEKIKTFVGGKTIIFIGTLIYQANNDAMKYFLLKIYPQIKNRLPGIKFTLISWHKPQWLKNYTHDPSINFIQDRETPAVEFLEKAAILVAPIRIASGTNIKILEAMAAGLPVVTTTIGAEGLAVKNGQEVIIADKPGEFVSAITALLADKKRRRQMGLAGRALVRQQYDWVKIAAKLEAVYRKLVNEKRN